MPKRSIYDLIYVNSYKTAIFYVLIGVPYISLYGTLSPHSH